MLVFASVGLVANIVGLLLLRSGSKASLNVKGACLEVLGDTLDSAAVIVAAIVIAVSGWQRADILASVLVALMILPRTWILLREATDVLLEAVPKGTDLDVIRQHILDTPGVLDALGECLAHHFDVDHCTFQLEPTGHADHEPASHH